MKRILLLLASGIFFAALSMARAENFGGISVNFQPMFSGETYHGYREYRILIENSSLKESHNVDLVYPDHAFGYGNSISRISRSVSLAPQTHALVPIWQPPLPQNGSSQMRVIVDGENVGNLSIPGNSHMNSYGRGGLIPATVFVSRSLNFDDLNRALQMESGAFSAAMATGPNDSGRHRGTVTTAWTPDTTASGPHWLELDFDKPIQADRVRIFETIGAAGSGEIILIGVSGTNLSSIPMVSAPSRPGMAVEYHFPLTPEPVKTVRLNFGGTYAGMISIDAVELESSSGAVWASAARASSELNPAATPAVGPSAGAGATRLLRAEMPVTDWSESWLSYTPFDAIALLGDDLRAMPAAIQTALWHYTEAGGTLLLFGNGTIPETWRAHRTVMDGCEAFEAGMGKCFVFASNRIQVSADMMKPVMTHISAASRNWQSLPEENAANAGFPVVADAKIPVRGIVIIMLAFVITIGPVNIIYLSRRNRRTWLLWTIPAISVATSFVVFAYSFLREGVTPDVRIEGVTWLDQVNRRAATFGMEAFYCPLTPGGGLFFNSETEVTPLVEIGNYSDGSDREVDWTQGQHLQRGWVSARVPAHFALRKSETRRERIQLENAGSEPVIVNGLGADIRTLWLADQSGKVYFATKIHAGDKAKLVANTEVPRVSQQLGPRKLADTIGLSIISGFETADATIYLRPGTYIADLETNPFIENGLGSRAKSARTKSRALVYGVLESNAQP
ncbi:MAG TPA: hypothetical protein VFW05_03855 [Verrucomicrobiae bacterium]|nr:hypothetical protein [Verrucomicrobiae bacterium]